MVPQGRFHKIIYAKSHELPYDKWHDFYGFLTSCKNQFQVAKLLLMFWRENYTYPDCGILSKDANRFVTEDILTGSTVKNLFISQLEKCRENHKNLLIVMSQNL